MKKRTLALVVLAISGWAFADTLETARWQAAIDAAAAKGGGRAVVYGGIVGENVKDVKICGWGVIDTGCYGRFGHSPESAREKSLSNLAFYGCTDVTVEGPVCVDAAYRCIRTDDCERVTFDNVKTAGQWRYDAGTSGAR